MALYDTMVPVRFLTMLAHLLAVLLVFSSRVTLSCHTLLPAHLSSCAE